MCTHSYTRGTKRMTPEVFSFLNAYNNETWNNAARIEYDWIPEIESMKAELLSG